MRPKFLVDNIQSIKAQTCQDIEQIFVVDRKKRGIQWADRALAENKHRMAGEWCMICDDDCWLINNNFVLYLKMFVGQHPQANVVMFKSKRPSGPPSNQTIFPTKEVWGKEPKHGTTNCLCYAIKATVWEQRIEYFGIKPWGGDWHFLERVIQDGHKLFWFDIMAAESRQLGRGKIFEDAKKGWFEKVAQQEGLENLGKDDWRLCLWKQSEKD